MGSGNSTLRNQILYYYLFHKKLELFFNNQYNPFSQNQNEEIKLERYYIINPVLFEIWKEYSLYDLHKYYLNKKGIYNISLDDYISKLEDKIKEVNDQNGKKDIKEAFYNDFRNDSNWYCKAKLKLENFDNIIDEKTYEYFKKILENELNSNIAGIITNNKLIIFFEKFCQIKFLYYGQSINQGIQNDKTLIQLTADFSQISNGIYDQYSTKDAYNGFKKLIQKNLNFAFKLFDEKNINYSPEETINFSADIGNGLTMPYKFILRNDSLNSKTLDQTYKTVNYQQLNPNQFKLVGLNNVGATCYMNATLQCFINVPNLTNYLLQPQNFMNITQNSNAYELSSAYCHLLYSVCCDKSVGNSYEPRNFKDVISRKNPLFQGVNANDSKDLVNFMLEEMNQELCKLYPKQNNNVNNQRNNMNINQLDKYSILNLFKSDFSKNNNSIIAQNFFFITETKMKCLSCKTLKYNYQVLYLLEFPLEMVHKFCIQNNLKYMDNGKNYISLMSCFEHNRLPTDFQGENQLYCNSCSRLSNSRCVSRLYSLPKTLIIILNRGRGKAFDCTVDFPSELNLNKYVLCPQSIICYKLTGVITHLGDSGMSGHFIAFCKNRINNMWIRYNDSLASVCQDQFNEYKIGTPYILFYESCDDNNNVLFDGKNVDCNSFKSNSNNTNIMMNNNMQMNNMMMNNNNIQNNNMMMNSNMNMNTFNNMNNNMNLNPKTFNNNMNNNMNMNIFNNNMNMKTFNNMNMNNFNNNMNNNMNAKTFNNNMNNNNMNMNTFNNNMNNDNMNMNNFNNANNNMNMNSFGNMNNNLNNNMNVNMNNNMNRNILNPRTMSSGGNMAINRFKNKFNINQNQNNFMNYNNNNFMNNKMNNNPNNIYNNYNNNFNNMNMMNNNNGMNMMNNMSNNNAMNNNNYNAMNNNNLMNCNNGMNYCNNNMMNQNFMASNNNFGMNMNGMNNFMGNNFNN